MNYLFCNRTVNSKNAKDCEQFYLLYPIALSGQWMDCRCRVRLYNSYTASGEGKPEHSSNFGTTLFLVISLGVTAETKCMIYTNE